MRVLSLGAGVQSTTVLLMALHGEIEPYDAAVFADTGAEPAAVYAHLERLTEEAEQHGLDIVRVTAGSLTDAVLDPELRAGLSVPVFIVRPGEQPGMLRRQCTDRFKRRPVHRWLQAHRDGQHVDLSMGISLDEVHRMADSRRRWISNVYPLIDQRMTRHDCQLWLTRHGWSAPRSACVYCPYHTDAEWRAMQHDDPAAWAEACRVDDAMRSAHAERIGRGNTTLTGTPYVHASCTPLADVDVRSAEDRGQLSLFGAECTGMCGV